MEMLASLPDSIALGLETALSANNLLYAFIGVFIGMFVGVLPGIGAMAAMSMLFPLTFHIDVTAAVIMLAGIWYGTSYGGNTAAILLNIPGTPASAVTCIDGYPMTQNGRAGVALFITTIASFCGGSIGIILMMVFSPVLVGYALSFGAAEYFSLMVLGLVAASTISSGSASKSLAMVVLGLMFGTVGMDIYTGDRRFTFGMFTLYDGISLVAVAMGLFGIAEVIAGIGRVLPPEAKGRGISMRSMIPTRDDWRRFTFPMLRGAGVGSFFGILPGTGPAIASFLSYGLEKRVARQPERFGRGAVEGVVAPESANNAADQTSFIPTMSLGIPGSPTMALVLGALLVNGITPGPRLISSHPDLFWGLIMSFWIGNVMLLFLNIPLIGLWVRLLTVPFRMLYPAILMFTCIGVYSIANSVVDLWTVVVFGVLGVAMRAASLPAAPLILGFVLGPMMEDQFRRAMLLSGGDFSTFFIRPLSGTIMLLTLALLVLGLWSGWRARRREAAADDANADAGPGGAGT